MTTVEWLVVLVICVLLSSLGLDSFQDYFGTRDGCRDAELDISADALKLKYAGLPPGCHSHIVAIFQERYGISLEYIGGCSPSTYRSAYNAAYNARVQLAIQRRDPTFHLAAAHEIVRELAEARWKAE